MLEYEKRTEVQRWVREDINWFGGVVADADEIGRKSASLADDYGTGAGQSPPQHGSLRLFQRGAGLATAYVELRFAYGYTPASMSAIKPSESQHSHY